MNDYAWKRITPLSKVDVEIDLSSVKPLYGNWHIAKQRLKESSARGLEEFNARLVRRLSVETGILERLYDLDRGTTEALVVHGFTQDLIERSSTNIEPARLVEILRDQEAAIKLVMDCVSSSKPLTKGIIHELQAILTRHQQTTSAVDTLGNRLEITLLKGKYKEQPNNPRRADGSLHEYCPPIHVDSEMDNLLHWLREYESEDPVLVAAWLHHRFTQVHPYQDGNGRVSRAIATLVLLKAGLLPLVIDRDIRVEYISSLEKADAGDLVDLVHLFGRLERNAILEALSVDADADIANQSSLTSAVIANLTSKFSKKKEERSVTLRKVNDVAIALRARAAVQLEAPVKQFKTSFNSLGLVQTKIEEGGSDRGTGHWYRFEVGKSAKESGRYANLTENHYFTKVSIKVGRERLVFILSFHHSGRDLSGIMELSSFARLESHDDSEERENASEEFVICSLDPFVLSNTTAINKVDQAFSKWVDAAFALAIREYGEKLLNALADSDS